jgi:hypothetical protein
LEENDDDEDDDEQEEAPMSDGLCFANGKCSYDRQRRRQWDIMDEESADDLITVKTMTLDDEMMMMILTAMTVATREERKSLDQRQTHDRLQNNDNISSLRL